MSGSAEIPILVQSRLEALVVRRIHQLEPRSRHIRGWQELHSWWLEYSLAHLLDLDDPLEGMAGIDARHLREKAWTSINVSARKFVAAQTGLRPIVHRFGRYRELEPKLNEWCRSFIVLVHGSVGKFEAEADSDVDLAIVVDSDRFSRCADAIHGLIVWPLKLRLLDEKLQRKFDGQKTRTDKYVLMFDYKSTLPDSSDDEKYHHLARILACGRPLHNKIEFTRFFAPYYANGATLPRQELAAYWRRVSQRHVEKLRDADRGQRHFWHSWFACARLYLQGLAVKYLDVREWGLNYFTLAERLHEAEVVRNDDWRTVRQAIVWALHIRNNWETNVVDHRQATLALSSLRDLNDATERLLGRGHQEPLKDTALNAESEDGAFDSRIEAARRS